MTDEGADFSGLEAGDVQVAYSLLNEEGYNAALNAASDPSTVKEADYETAATAQVKSITTDGSSMTVSFVDSNAAANRTDYYALYIESRQIAASVFVEFNDYHLTSDTEYVLASDDTIPLTLTLDDGQFVQTVTEDDITLSGGFEGLTIANISSSDKNLTMQLTGEIKKHEASNAYLDGTVEVAAKVIKDAGEAERITIPVRTKSAYFGDGEITFHNGSATVPLFLFDCGVDTSALAKDDISFYKTNEEGGETPANITVADVERKSDSEFLLTLGVPEAADKNDVAKALSGVTVKIGDNFKFASNVTTAVFYPVFDYVEDDGENQNLTLELYSRNGTFAYPLTKNMFELGDDFTGGQVLSVTRTSDTVAELKISVPANNQTVDDLDKTGTITANAGVLVNEWGEVTDEACGYTRRYTQDSLGRDLTAPDIDTIKGIVGGFGNTALGTITSVASGVTGGLEAVMTILDLTGIVPNKTSQTLTLLKQVADNVQTVLDLMNRQIEIMRDVQSQTYKLQLSDFDAKLATLNDRNGRLATYYGYAKTDLGIDPDSETKPYPTADDMKDLGKMKELAAKIVAHCKEEEAKGTNKYLNFTKNFNELVTAYGDVAVKATLPSDENPMGVFDKFCTLTYNFDTSTYEARTAQRLDIEYALKEGFLNIALYYGCEFTEGEINPDLQSAKTHLVAFENLINEDTSEGKQKGAFAVVKNTSSGAYSYVLNMNLKRSLTCFTHEGTCVVDNVGTNFDADQEKNFVTRMQGRTMAEELDLAGFDYSLIKGATIGMPLKNWSEKDGAWSFGDVRKFKHWYSDVIKWNDTKVSSKVKTCYEWKWQSYATVGLWTKV